MVRPVTPNSLTRGKSRPLDKRKAQRALNVPLLVGTILTLATLAGAAYFWRNYQLRRTSRALAVRAEALAAEQEVTPAMVYYARYLELRPEDTEARLRRAELYDQAAGGRVDFRRAIGFYRETLMPASQRLSVEKELQARRRLTELLLQSGAFDDAESERKNLQELEEKELAQKPEEQQWPGLKALILVEKFTEMRSGQSLATSDKLAKAADELNAAIKEVLEPEKGKPKFYVAPEVYIARYNFCSQYNVRLHQKVPSDATGTKASEEYLESAEKFSGDLEAAVELAQTNLKASEKASGDLKAAVELAQANLKASEKASGDLKAAVELAQTNLKASEKATAKVTHTYTAVLLTAADYSARACVMATAVLREATKQAAQTEYRQKAAESYPKATDYFERAINVAPTDPRAYLSLGRLYEKLGNIDRAIEIWQRGLKKTKEQIEGIDLGLALAEALIQQGRLAEAEKVLKNLREAVAKLDPGAKLAAQRLVDLRSAKVAYQRGSYDEAIRLVADLANSNEVGTSRTTTPQERYEAWMVSGNSHAAQKDSGPALNAYYQAALLESQSVVPHLAAAEVCKSAGHIDIDAAIASYRKALDIVNARKMPPEGQRQAILSSLLEEPELGKEIEPELRKKIKESYDARRTTLMGESAQLTLPGVALFIRYGKPDEALAVAQRGVESRPDDPVAYLAVGLAQRANKDGAKAADAYHQAFEKAKDAPEMQMDLVEYLLQTKDSNDAAEAEKALRGLLPRHAPAALRLVRLLELRGKSDDALAVAQVGVKSLPKDPVTHIALGTALWGKKENAKAETAFKDAVALAPDASGPARALLEFYARTGQEKLGRDTLNEMLRKAKLSEIDRELFRADCLVLLGDRKDAKDAYCKAVAAAKDDPTVQMRLAEFLLGSSDPADDAEGETLLRRIKRQYDPARRRLAEVLIKRGGEQEWEEAQKLLQQTAGDPASVEDRFVQALSMTRRQGAENLDKAATICQKLVTEANEAKRAVPAVHLLLAQIRERQDKMDDARKEYLLLIDQERPDARQLATYVAFLLRRGPADEADRRLKQLEKLAPEDLGAVLLRARWLRDQKRTAEIDPLVEGIAQKLQERIGKDNPRQSAQLDLDVGNLYEGIEQYPSAERWYRRFFTLDPDEGYYPLAISLAKQGRIKEAITLCDEIGKSTTSVRPALALTKALASGWATAKDLDAADPYLTKALENHKDQFDLMANVAAIRVLQDRSDEAIELYRQILAHQPRKSAEVLNNLATLLAERPEPEKRKEALDFVEQAINLVGPQPGLLDTKGMALFFDGKPDQAFASLQEAAQAPIPDPRLFFHLAVVCGKLGQLDQARAAFQQARSADLDHQLLTKTDRQLLADLEKRFGL